LFLVDHLQDVLVVVSTILVLHDAFPLLYLSAHVCIAHVFLEVADVARLIFEQLEAVDVVARKVVLVEAAEYVELVV
jgi:hypothetical protein